VGKRAAATIANATATLPTNALFFMTPMVMVHARPKACTTASLLRKQCLCFCS